MFWSDATHLTNFSDAKLWPLYLFFGGDSKYLRCKPSCHLCEHIAYFQTVSQHVLNTSPCHLSNSLHVSSQKHSKHLLLHRQQERKLQAQSSWLTALANLCMSSGKFSLTMSLLMLGSMVSWFCVGMELHDSFILGSLHIRLITKRSESPGRSFWYIDLGLMRKVQ